MSNRKIKLIIFDGYGVILYGGYHTTCEILARKFKIKKDHIYEILYTKYFNQAAMKKITQKEAWARALKELNIPMNVKGIQKLHFSHMGVLRKTLDTAKRLKKHYQIMLLSKNTRSQFGEMNRRFPEIKNVFGRNVINTWEYNLPKAGKETIRWICRRMKVKPNEIIYTDDQDINLPEAKKSGVHTILFKNYKQFNSSLSKILKNHESK